MNFTAILHKQIPDEQQRMLVLEFREKLMPYPEALGALTQRIQGNIRIELFLSIILKAVVDDRTVQKYIKRGTQVGPLSENADNVTKMVYVLDQVLTSGFPRSLLSNFKPLEKESRMPSKRSTSSGYVTKRINRK